MEGWGSSAEIAGTDYRSREERLWFLVNCAPALTTPKTPPTSVPLRPLPGFSVWQASACPSRYAWFDVSTTNAWCIPQALVASATALYGGVSGSRTCQVGWVMKVDSNDLVWCQKISTSSLFPTPVPQYNGYFLSPQGGISDGDLNRYPPPPSRDREPNFIPYEGNGEGPTDCSDGTTSHSAGSGTCSHHGGIAR